MSLRPFLSILFALVALAPATSARGEAAPERLTGLVVEQIRVQAAPREDETTLLALSGLRPGSPYSASAVRRAVKRLYQVGRFENVYVHAARVGNVVHLRLELPPRPTVKEVRVLSSAALSSAEVEEAVGLSAGSEIDAYSLTRRREALAAVLRRRGHRSAAVGLALEELDPNGGRALLVRIDEGPETVLRQLVVRGTPRLPLSVIARQLGIEPGQVIDERRVEASLGRLLAEYRRRGYLDAKLAPPRVRELTRTDAAPASASAGSPRADLVLEIEAGPRTAVRFKGNRIIGTRELASDTALLEELGTGPSALAEARERLLARYERRGHWQAQVEAAARVTSDGARKEVLFSIREGPASRVARLEFPGNIFDEALLTRTVHEIVGLALLEDRGKPGADPETVAKMMGDRSLAKPRDSVQPGNVAPDARLVYLPRAYRAAADAIADLYRAEGYQLVEVRAPVVRPRPNSALIDVVMEVHPGVKWVVGALSFVGNESLGAAELLEASGLDPSRKDGQPLSFALLDQARRRVIGHYRGKGYLYASVQDTLRQVQPRGNLGPFGVVETSSTTPLLLRGVCARAEREGRATCEVEVLLRVNEGPLVRAREIIVRGLSHTREGVVASQVRVRKGEPLAEGLMTQTRDNLLRIGVFERVTVTPLDEDQVAAEKDVVVELRERRRLSLEVGVGASTEEGVRATAAFGNANLYGTGLRLQLQSKLNVWLPPLLLLYGREIRSRIQNFYDQFGTLGRLEYEVAAGLSYPRIFGLPPGFSAGLDLIVFRDFDPAFLENTQVLTLIGTYKGFRPNLAGGPRPMALQLRINAIRSDLQCNPEINDRPELCSTTFSGELNPRVQGSNAYFSVGPRVSWDFRDDALDPTAGLFFQLDSEVARGLDERSADLVRLEGRANIYVPLMESVGLAFSMLAGKVVPLETLDPAGGLDIPVNRRLFAGGRSTIRGYPEKTLLPQDVPIDRSTGLPATAISSGGLLLVALKSELRFTLFGALSLAVFYDVGDLFESGVFSLQTDTQRIDGEVVSRFLAQGAGVGFRVATPIGPLAVDLAFPINKRDPGAENPQLHFSVGTF